MVADFSIAATLSLSLSSLYLGSTSTSRIRLEKNPRGKKKKNQDKKLGRADLIRSPNTEINEMNRDRARGRSGELGWDWVF